MPEDLLEQLIRSYARRAAILPEGDKRESMLENFAELAIQDFYKYNPQRVEYMLNQYKGWVVDYRKELQKKDHHE